MSDYPAVVFTNRARKKNRPNQRIFTEFGCWESVNVDFFESEPVVFARKHRPLHVVDGSNFGFSSTPQAVDSRVLTPEHDFLTFNNPEPITDLIDDPRLDELCVQRVKKILKKKIRCFYAAPLQKYISNLARDHPDVMQGTFTKLMDSATHSSDCKSEATAHKAASVKNAIRYLHHIDPTLCDVGAKFLRETVMEELQQQITHLFADRSFSGGSLKYNCLGRSGNEQYGFLACPQGQALDELSVKLVCINSSSQLDSGVASTFSSQAEKLPPLVPSLHSGSDYRQTLNGRILQIETAPSDQPGNFIVGVRSDYYVLLNMFKSSFTEWDSESARYTSDEAISAAGLLKTSGGSEVTSIALSPYMAGECVLATSDRCVRLWNVDIGARPLVEKLEVLMTGTMGSLRSSNPWRQVRYAAHPRQLYVADSLNTCLFDMRTQNDSISLLNTASSVHTEDDEEIYCIEGCSQLGNEYQCLVATDCNLFLMDQRHCGEPLLHWGTHMSNPPLYMRPCHVTTWKPTSEFMSHNWCYDTMSVFLGNQRAKEVYAYQFCNTSQADQEQSGSSDGFRYSPQSIGPPKTLGSFNNVWKTLKNRPFQHHTYLQRRTSKMTLGLEAIPLDCEQGEKKPGSLLLMQINAVGDIGYQTLSMRPTNEAYDLTRLITGKTSATFLTEEEENSKKKLEELKEENHYHWAESACIPLTKSSEGKEEGLETCSGISGLHIAPHDEYLADGYTDYMTQIGTDAVGGCISCRMHGHSSLEEQQHHQDVACDSCGMEIQCSEVVYQRLKQPDKALNSEICCSTHPSKGGRIHSNLKLIDLQQIEERGNELAKLLKGTWSKTYEDYWHEKRCIEDRKKEEEKLEQNRSTLDLSSHTSSPKKSRESTWHSPQPRSAEKNAGVKSVPAHGAECGLPGGQTIKREATSSQRRSFSFMGPLSQSMSNTSAITSRSTPKREPGDEHFRYGTSSQPKPKSGSSGFSLFSPMEQLSRTETVPFLLQGRIKSEPVSHSPRKHEKRKHEENGRLQLSTHTQRDSLPQMPSSASSPDGNKRLFSPMFTYPQNGKTQEIAIESSLDIRTDRASKESSPLHRVAGSSAFLSPERSRNDENKSGDKFREINHSQSPLHQKMPPSATLFTIFSTPQNSSQTRSSATSESPKVGTPSKTYSFFSPRAAGSTPKNFTSPVKHGKGAAADENKNWFVPMQSPVSSSPSRKRKLDARKHSSNMGF